MEETKKQRQAEGALFLDKLKSEWHLSGFNFNGPWTEVESRLNLKYKGKIGTQNPHIPANILDYYAVIHDMMYFIPNKLAMAAADAIYVSNVLTNRNIKIANKAIGTGVIGAGVGWHAFQWAFDYMALPYIAYNKGKNQILEIFKRDLLNVVKQWKPAQQLLERSLNSLGIHSITPPGGQEQKLGFLAPGAANTRSARKRLWDKYGSPVAIYGLYNLFYKVYQSPYLVPEYVGDIAKTSKMIYNSFPELRKVQEKYNEYLLSIGKFDEQGNFVIYDKIDKERAKQQYVAFFDEWKNYIKFVNINFKAGWDAGDIDEADISKVYDIKKFDKEYELSQLAEMNKIEEAFKSYTKIYDLPNINSSITNNIFQDIPLAEMNITAEQRRGIEHLGHNLRYLPKEKQLEILNELVDDANKEYGLNITIKEADRNNPDKAYNKTFNKILQNVKRDQETLNKLIQLDEKYDNKIDEIVSNATLTTTTTPPAEPSAEPQTTTTTTEPPETTTTTTTQPPTTTTPSAEPSAEPQPTSSAEGIPPFMKISTVPEIKEKKTPEQRKEKEQKQEKNEPRPTETAPIKDTLVSGINPIQSLINKYMKYTKEDARRELLAMMAFVPSDANGGIGTEKTNELIKGNTATFNRTINGHLYDDWYDNTELTNTNNNSLQHKIKKKDVVQHFQYERLKTRAANIKNSRNSKKVLLNQIQTAYETNDFKPLVNPPGCYMYGSPYADGFEPLAANPNNGPHFDDYYKNENYFGNS